MGVESVEVTLCSEGSTFVFHEYDVEPVEEFLPAVEECAGCGNVCVAPDPSACGTAGIVVERDGGVDGPGITVVAGPVINGACCRAG